MDDLKPHWEWGWAAQLDLPIIGMPFAVGRTDNWGISVCYWLFLGPWYVSRTTWNRRAE